MKTFLIYFFLLTFFLEYSLGLEFTHITGISWFNLTVYLLLLVWAFSIVFKRKLFEWINVNTYLLLFIFVVILSIPHKILLDEVPTSLLSEIISLKNWINTFIFFFIIFNVIDKKKTCKRAIFGLVILLFITALSTPLISLKIINIGLYHKGRAAGFGDPNEFSAYLVLFIPLILTFVLFLKSNTLKAFSVVVLLVTFVALVTTGSRGGIFSFCASMLIYLFIIYREKLIKISALFSIMMIIILFSALSFLVSPSAGKTFAIYKLDPTKSESVDEYSSGRLMIWKNGLEIFAERPIFGHGLNSFKKLIEIRFGIDIVAHNQYLSHLVEFGIIGLTLFILLLLRVIKTIWNYQKATTDLWEKKMYISYIAGLVGYTFAILFINPYNSRYIFWFYTAVMLRHGKLGEIDQGS